MIKLKYILILVSLWMIQLGFAQELTAHAHAKFKTGEFDSARIFIDQAIQTNEKSYSQTWQLRGLIYRKLESPENPQYREVALESFIEARNVDTANVYKEKINEYIYNTIIRYYNDAVTQLNEKKLVESERSYILFKEKYWQLIDTAKSFTDQDIEYYNALGTAHSEQLNHLDSKEYEITFTLAINAFKKVLVLDSMNYQANLNSAVLYYNRGVELVENPDENGTIDELLYNIDLSNQLFLKALPLMQKAHMLNPDSPEVIEGLAGIYFSLYDQDNWMIYQTKLDIINLPKYLESVEKNPNDKDALKQLVRIYSSTLKDEAEYLKFKAILDQLGG